MSKEYPSLLIVHTKNVIDDRVFKSIKLAFGDTYEPSVYLKPNSSHPTLSASKSGGNFDAVLIDLDTLDLAGGDGPLAPKTYLPGWTLDILIKSLRNPLVYILVPNQSYLGVVNRVKADKRAGIMPNDSAFMPLNRDLSSADLGVKLYSAWEGWLKSRSQLGWKSSGFYDPDMEV